MKPISTKLHGVLDYLSVGTLAALPRLMGWDPAVRGLLTGAALGTLAYSLTTRYELGVLRVLPMKAHLALDGASGVAMAVSPLLLKDEARSAAGALVGIGLFELGASLLTRTQPNDGFGERVRPEETVSSFAA